MSIISSSGSSYQPTAPGPTPNGPGAYTGAGASIQARTPAAGYTLINGTGNILTWTAPNDGNLHTLTIVTTLNVTVNEAGGQLTISYTSGGQAEGPVQITAAQNVGSYGFTNSLVCDPGTTVTVNQNTALTAGAAKAYITATGQ